MSGRPSSHHSRLRKRRHGATVRSGPSMAPPTSRDLARGWSTALRFWPLSWRVARIHGLAGCLASQSTRATERIVARQPSKRLLVCPRGLRHANSVLVPIHARDEWESAAGEDIA